MPRKTTHPNPRPPSRLHRRSSKLGLPAGSLVHTGERRMQATALTLFNYDETGLEEVRFDNIEASRNYQPRYRKIWLNVHGLHDPAVMQEIGRRFNLHPLMQEDILNTDSRVKVEDYGDTLFVVGRILSYETETESTDMDQVSIVLGQNFVLSFQEQPRGALDSIRERLRQDRGNLRKQSSDFLAYALLDVLVDRCFISLDALTEHTEKLEEDILDPRQRDILIRLHRARRETLALRRVIWPLRESISSLQRGGSKLLQPETLLYLRDVYDHSVHLLESIDALRDLQSGMLDVYLSSVSNKVNSEVRMLTVITTLFMPATLIAGIFGMNFHNMPVLEEHDGFYWSLAGMGLIAVVMLGVFWRSRWLK